MGTSDVLHGCIPPAIVPEVDHLLDQYGHVLTRDCRHAPVIGAAAVLFVARGAGAEQLGTMLEIGLELDSLAEFADRCVRSLGKTRRLGGKRSRDLCQQESGGNCDRCSHDAGTCTVCD
jgi:hypothetical protein